MYHKSTGFGLLLASSLGSTSNNALDGLSEIADLSDNVTDPFAGKHVEITFWRAGTAGKMKSIPMENYNAASIAGDLKYMHTEVVIESLNQVRGFTTRKYGIDSFMPYNMKVLNTDKLKAGGGALFVDFGQFVTYDYAQATNYAQHDMIKEYGGWVGVTPQSNPHWPTLQQSYWFSVNGACPNLPYHCTAGSEWVDTPQCGGKPIRNPVHLCSRMGFGRHGCPAKWILWDKEHAEISGKDGSNLHEKCYKLRGHGPGGGKKIMGGLCKDEEGAKPQFGKNPTGDPDCTYSYTFGTTYNLDDIVGITKQKCYDKDGSEGPCKSWNDFHHNCVNRDYFARLFDGPSGKTKPYRFCAEYDTPVVCYASCAKACAPLVAKGMYEFGIPFWLNKCDALANEKRTEDMAYRFGMAYVVENHITVDLKQIGQRCTPKGSATNSCTPSTTAGGPYCSRRWGGVCTECYTPGAVHGPYHKKRIDQLFPCPHEIFEDEGEYSDKQPECATAAPRDLCCLYNAVTCKCQKATLVKDCLDIEKTDVNLDGLAVAIRAATLRGTSEFLKFVGRLSTSDGSLAFPCTPQDHEKIHDWAHWYWWNLWRNGEWEGGVTKANIDHVKADVKAQGIKWCGTPPPTPAPTPHPSPATPTRDYELV